MALFDLFRRPAPIATRTALDGFLAEQTAFLVQKTTWEYSRARAGVLWQKLFKEEGFKRAIETSTWANYPLCLAFNGEMTAATLRNAGMAPPVAVAGVAAACRRVIGAHPLPRDFETGFWAEAGRFVDERIARTLLAPPKAVKDIPDDGHARFFERLPIHPDLTRHDRQLLHNTLRVHLCRAHETLLGRLDVAGLTTELAIDASATV